MKKAKAKRRPSPPEEIDGAALLEWQRMVDQLEADGLLEGIDVSLLLVYCRTFGTWAEADRHVQKFGSVIKHPNGIPYVNPFQKIIEKITPQLVLLRDKIYATAAKRIAAKPASEDLTY